MSSFQQIPVGIPASQNPYPSLPYSQFSNEPETESPQLQAPFNNRPQHSYPPLNHFGYGQQQPVLMGQPGQFYGVPQGPNQGPQYMMIPIDPERRGLDMKISDIDKTLDSGWYFVYKIYLYISIVGAVLGLLQLSSCLVFLPMIPEFEGTIATITIVALLILMSIYVWSLHYSLILKNAMSDKNLKGARRGLKSLIGYSIYSLVITIILIGAVEYAKSTGPPEIRRDNWMRYYVQAFLYLYALPTFVMLFGAKKIIDLLVQRDTLVHEVNTKFGTNLV